MRSACVSRTRSIFSDGTGQAGGLTPDQNISNIYKLYRATRCGPENNIDPSQQLTFYDPGLGSQPDSGLLFVTRAYHWLRDVVSQATGLGITKNIIDCYAALLSVATGRSHLSFWFQPRRLYRALRRVGLVVLRHSDDDGGRKDAAVH